MEAGVRVHRMKLLPGGLLSGLWGENLMERMLLTGVFTGLALIACAPAMIQQEWLSQRTVGPASVQVSARTAHEAQIMNTTWVIEDDDCRWFSLTEG